MSEADSKNRSGKSAGRSKKGRRRKKSGWLREFISLSIYLLSILILTFLLINFVVQRTVVSGGSMEQTLYDGENLLVDKITYRFHEPKRFDIIVFPYAQSADSYYIKRIIGLPGEAVYINEDGQIYIDGEKLSENYGNAVIENPGMAGDTVYLGSDEYFVLGDNRNHSSDSRDPSIGSVSRSQIVGRAWLRTYPFAKWGKLR